MIKIIGGMIPTVIWMIVIGILDKNRKNRNYRYLILLMIVGGIGSYLSYRLEMHYGSYFKKVKDSNYWEILFYAIFGVAIFEEGYKWVIAFFSSLLKKEKIQLDLFIQSIYISLGFCTIENILFYTIPYGINTGIQRIYTAYISHIINGMWMGYFLEKAFQNLKRNRIINIPLSLVVPILIHALYNSFLYGNKYQQFFPYYYILLIISGMIITIIIQKKKKDKK